MKRGRERPRCCAPPASALAALVVPALAYKRRDQRSNPDSTVWIEEEGVTHRLPGIRFEEGALITALEVIANQFGKRLNADSPILNLRLPDGSRLATNLSRRLVLRQFQSISHLFPCQKV